MSTSDSPLLMRHDADVRAALEASRVIAVVGLSNDRGRPAYGVARYLQAQGYRIIPVNPGEREVLGEQAYPDLESVPEPIDIVDLFRRSSAVSGHVDETIRKGAQLIWYQLGVHDAAAAERARAAGIAVVENRCIAVEQGRLIGRAR